MPNVKAIPEGYRTLTPYLCVHDATRALDFYKRALGATEIMRHPTPDGKIAHAELKIGDSMFMLSDEMPGGACQSPQSLGGTPIGIWIYTEDVDSLFNRAVQAGATVKMPLADMFWGDRWGQLVDPFGHSWSLATHTEDVAPAEMQRRAQAEMAKMAQRAQRARS
jgi:PhnB protein